MGFEIAFHECQIFGVFLPTQFPDDVLQALNRTGHSVEQHREMIPVPMSDGRRLIVPIDQVDVHYVGNETY